MIKYSWNMRPVYFKNRYQNNGIAIYAQREASVIMRDRQSLVLTEITEAEAFETVRKIGHLPAVKLYGIAPAGALYYDNRRRVQEHYGITPTTVEVPR